MTAQRDYYFHLGEAIRQARQERGLTQLRLATELDLASQVSIHNWETGKRTPDAWTVDRLERYFGRRLRP
jgi:ribosome-binding protein aMBF1 (putative translation factor)